MTGSLAQNELRALPGRLNVVPQIRTVDLPPDRMRLRRSFLPGQLRVAIEIRFGVAKNGFAELEKSRNIPVFNSFLVCVDVNRKIEKIADECSRPAARLQNIEPFDDQNVRMAHGLHLSGHNVVNQV